MDNLQKLLDERYPLNSIPADNFHRTELRHAFEEGYKNGAVDQVFELREILSRCWHAGRRFGESKSDLNFNDFMDKLLKPKTESNK